MPIEAKKSIAAITLACIALVGAILSQEQDYKDPIAVATNLIYFGIIIWLIYDISKRKDVRKALMMVIYILSAFFLLDYVTFLLPDYTSFGFELYQVFYLAEIILLMLAAHYLNSPGYKLWVSKENI